LANERWKGRSWRRFLGCGREVVLIQMRRQKNSGQGGDRAWSRGNRRGVREGRDVNNQEWS